MRTISIISTLLSLLSIGGAHLYGRLLYLANPSGLQTYTPAHDQQPIMEPAYPVGFLIGGAGTALCIFFAALSFFMAARFFWVQYRVIAGQIITSSVICGVVTFLAVIFVEATYGA